MVLEKGIIEGRRTYANMIKYIKMTASSNFGNVLSMLIAAAFLPFLPMTAIQILILNLIYDISCASLPWDHVDEDFLKIPRTWDASSISRFMVWIGPTSSVFDIISYAALYLWIAPAIVGSPFHLLTDPGQIALFIAIFQAGWMVAFHRIARLRAGHAFDGAWDCAFDSASVLTFCLLFQPRAVERTVLHPARFGGGGVHGPRIRCETRVYQALQCVAVAYNDTVSFNLFHIPLAINGM